MSVPGNPVPRRHMFTGSWNRTRLLSGWFWHCPHRQSSQRGWLTIFWKCFFSCPFTSSTWLSPFPQLILFVFCAAGDLCVFVLVITGRLKFSPGKLSLCVKWTIFVGLPEIWSLTLYVFGHQASCEESRFLWECQHKCKTSCGASDWWDISCPSITPVSPRILFQRRTQTLEYLRCLTVLVGVRLCSRIGVLNATIMYDTYKSYTNTGEML